MAHWGYALHRTAHSNSQRYCTLRPSCCASARSSTPWPTSKTRTEAGHRRASTRTPFLDVHLALDASARRLRHALNPQLALSRQKNGFSELLAASPTGSNSTSECTSKNLAFPSTPVATTCLSPTVLYRHSRTLNHADLDCGFALLAGALQSQRVRETGINDAAKDTQ